MLGCYMLKTNCASATTLEICAQIGVCIFNEGSVTLLKIMRRQWMSKPTLKFLLSNAILNVKKALQEQEQAYLDLEGLLYGPGIDD